jgi:predicted DCC family thiol-disulfide oxidoreductase YuxK
LSARQGAVFPNFLAFFLLYDSDCHFCADFAGWVHRRDREGRIELVPFTDPRAKEWIPDPQALHASFHLVGPGGRIRSGHEALAPLADMTLGRAARLMLELLPEAALRRTYRWVSEHRWR